MGGDFKWALESHRREIGNELGDWVLDPHASAKSDQWQHSVSREVAGSGREFCSHNLRICSLISFWDWGFLCCPAERQDWK